MLRGTAIVYAVVLLCALLCLPMLLGNFAEDSLRQSIRLSVDLSFPLFFLAFGAASLHRYTRSALSGWALRNRRYLGIGFGIAFLLHGALLVMRGLLYPEPWLSELGPETLVPGGVGFAFAAAMLFTSNDAAVRNLGRPAWSALHTTGGYVLTLLFIGAFLPKIAEPFFWPYLAGSLLLLVLRLALAIERRRSTAQEPPAPQT